MTDAKQPEKVTDKNLKATLWPNEGKNGPFVSVELTRIYKDKDGNYHDGRSFGLSDISRISAMEPEITKKGNEMQNEMNRSHNMDREEFENNRRESRAPQPERENQR